MKNSICKLANGLVKLQYDGSKNFYEKKESSYYWFNIHRNKHFDCGIILCARYWHDFYLSGNADTLNLFGRLIYICQEKFSTMMNKNCESKKN